jgi:putative ABC transport system permease protein
MLIDIDKWQEIFSTIKKHKLRTTLTAFGGFWGIFMLVVLLGAGNGLRNAVFRNFDWANNVVFLWTMRTSMPYQGFQPGRSINLDNRDVAAIRSFAPEVGLLAPRTGLAGDYSIDRGKKSASFTVMGDYPQFNQIKKVLITDGRFINPLDIESRRKVAVIGRRVKELLFEDDENPIGEYIKIKGVFFKVVGTFDTNKSGDEAIEDVQTIHIPNTTLQQAFNQPNEVWYFSMVPAPGYNAFQVEDKVKKILSERHKVHPDDERAFGVANIEEEYNKIQGLFLGISGFSWMVSIGTIIAGMVGVGNIMLIIVKERTKEIGIRKSMGATPLSIISLIVQEALVISGVSGYLGLLVGVALVEGIDAAMQSSGAEVPFFYNPEINFQVATSALLVLVLSGVLAGFFPGRKAAKVNPVIALKDE